MIEVFKEFRFEAAHSLPHLPLGHKCRNVHGHSYKVTVFAKCLRRYLKDGMVIDYAELSKSWQELYAALDHKFINDISGLELSTAEMLAMWIYGRMKAHHPQIYKVVVKETDSAGAIYERQ